MKTINILPRLLLFVLAIGLASAANAQCAISFFDSTYNSQADFYNTSNGGIGTMYDWSFPGGTPSSVTGVGVNNIPNVTYPSAGYYLVCLTMYDTANNCIDSLCDSIYVQPLFMISTGSGTNTACGQCNGSATVSTTGGTTPYSYIWSNGATTQTTGGLCAGIYSVTVNDANGAASYATVNILGNGAVIATATASNSAPCYADTILLSASATGGSSPYTYSWNTGETTSSIVHAPTTSTTFSVTVTDVFGCSDVATVAVTVAPQIVSSTSATAVSAIGTCDGSASVTATGGVGSLTFLWSNSATTASISSLCAGLYTVTISDTVAGCEAINFANILNPVSTCTNAINGIIFPVTESTVYLIEENAGVLSLVDSVNLTPFDSGYYYFGGLCAGTYYVKAALDASSTQFSSYLPTYYVQSALWGSATAVVASGNVTGIDINLLTGSNLGGPGFIGGLISQGANRAEGDPIVDADVILMDLNDAVLATTKSDANGEYSFENLPTGDYKVLVDLINFDPYPHTISITDENASYTTKNFSVEGGIVRPNDPVGILSNVNAQAVKVFPNPVSEQLTITGEAITSLVMFDMMGQQVMNITMNNESRFDVSVTELAQGQYMLRIESANGVSHLPVVKK